MSEGELTSDLRFGVREFRRGQSCKIGVQERHTLSLENYDYSNKFQMKFK